MNKSLFLLSDTLDGLAPATPPMRKGHRFSVLYVFLALILAVLLVRSFQLQIIRGSSFLVKAEGNRVALLPLEGSRGILYDRNHVQLVENIASTDVVLDPTLLPKKEDESPLLEILPGLVKMNPEDIQRLLAQARSQQRITVLSKAISHEMVLEVEEKLQDIPGVRLVSSSVRKYPHNLAMSHVLGYTNGVTAEELSENKSLQPTDQTGKTGIEKIYDTALRGTYGAEYTEINANGRPIATLGRKDAEPGHDLNTTVNVGLQEFIYDILKQYYEKKETEQGAAVIVMEPDSGAIHALVSYPGYDPNSFSLPEQRATSSQFFSNPLQPLFNRAINGAYPPGSTIKPLLAAAALEEGLITPDTKILSTGGIDIGPWHFPDWKAGGHGMTDLNKAIAESVNTFFYLISGGDETRPGLGVEKITRYLKAFQWGQTTGIDIPGESSGFIPSARWKKETKNETWYIGDTYHLGIGQGDVLATPLQVTVATAAIANGGKIPSPYIITASPTKNDYLPISSANLAAIRTAMRSTVTDGSGRALKDLSIPLAGKTGTAQIGGTENTHAWFTSFGPVEKPHMVVTVLLERSGAGDEEAVPIAKEIWKWLQQHNEV